MVIYWVFSLRKKVYKVMAHCIWNPLHLLFVLLWFWTMSEVCGSCRDVPKTLHRFHMTHHSISEEAGTRSLAWENSNYKRNIEPYIWYKLSCIKSVKMGLSNDEICLAWNSNYCCSPIGTYSWSVSAPNKELIQILERMKWLLFTATIYWGVYFKEW